MCQWIVGFISVISIQNVWHFNFHQKKQKKEGMRGMTSVWVTVRFRKKSAIKRCVRPCFNMLTGDNRGVFRLFVCLQLAVLSCRVEPSCVHGLRYKNRRQTNGGLTSTDDAPLAVQYEPALRFHGALWRQALIRSLEITWRCWSRAGDGSLISACARRRGIFTLLRMGCTLHVRAHNVYNYFKGNT